MSKVSQATLIGLGLVGPKARLKSVVDGQQVNIPVQFNFRPSKTGGILKSTFKGLRFCEGRFLLTESGASSGVTR